MKLTSIAAGLLAALSLVLMTAGAGAQDLKGLPSGGALKDVPALRDLPGVRMDLGSNGAPQGNCTQETVSSFDYRSTAGDFYPGGLTMQRCKVGRLSFGVVGPQPFGGSKIPGMQQFHGHYHPIEQHWRPH